METIKCTKKAVYRYTWPGRDEELICEEHVIRLRNVATTLGFHLQIIPLSEADLIQGLECTQKLDVTSLKTKIK